MSKRTVVVMLVVGALLLCSCTNLVLADADGFHLWRYYRYLTQTNVILQSQNTFVIAGVTYSETVQEKPVLIENVSSQSINIKLTDRANVSSGLNRWLVLSAGSSLLIE